MRQEPENYCNDLWPRFYDQYYGEDNTREAPFYLAAATKRPGPILEIGCGTGLLLLQLLELGADIHGIDVSTTMIAKMLEEAPPDLRAQIHQRVQQADMQTLNLDRRFEQIFVPARTFLHAASLQKQLDTLQAFRRHLRPGGRLLLNFFVPDLYQILNAHHQPEEEPFDRFVDPASGQAFNVYITRRVTDINAQRIDVDWRFALPQGDRHSRMALRYVGRDEFELMLRLSGFARWTVYGSADQSPFVPSSEEMYWIAEA